MNVPRFLRLSFLTLLLCSFAVTVSAQDKPAKPAKPAASDFQPEVGQAGKDVVWVPTPQALVDKMLDVAKATPKDFLMDLGSGDGRTVITAAKRGIDALGIEYNPDMVELSQKAAQKEGVSDKAKFTKADLFETDFSKATVITMFLLPDINIRLRPKILNLKPGTRIVSNSFTMGEWQHDSTVKATEAEGCQSYCQAYLWIVPAKVEGTWQVAGGELTLKQTFQMLTGTLKVDGQDIEVKGQMRGDRITLKGSNASQYSGTVAGGSIKGTVKGGAKPGEWTATRKGA